ncbi:hypothetical protein NFX46_16885 [Streptomyces phaeoluteigriseus]|uniref:Uncharacterized protein n=1 Tax=Streptomyces phaeoluteigriseus TaxID=114686 RepID=A0ABY4Z8X0_9ACTN|nr:hypothetical protein [Streptomyces phaeoluteigriseus]USQ85307.1 hypothetical protein NFX46_16885 [Streptomyces phaeoluteigriseus]
MPARTTAGAVRGVPTGLRTRIKLRVKLDDPPTVSVTGPSYDPTDSTPPRVTAVVQRRREGVADDDLAWVTLEDTGVELTSIDADSSHRASYTGQVPMPPDQERARLRLLVLETDGMPSDAATPHILNRGRRGSSDGYQLGFTSDPNLPPAGRFSKWR